MAPTWYPFESAMPDKHEETTWQELPGHAASFLFNAIFRGTIIGFVVLTIFLLGISGFGTAINFSVPQVDSISERIDAVEKSTNYSGLNSPAASTQPTEVRLREFGQSDGGSTCIAVSGPAQDVDNSDTALNADDNQ